MTSCRPARYLLVVFASRLVWNWSSILSDRWIVAGVLCTISTITLGVVTLISVGKRANQRSRQLSISGHVQRVFVGLRGLRAGWKVLLFFLIVFGVGICLRPLGKLSGAINP